MERAERMVKAAIDAHPAFDGYRSSIKVYAKGSYANRTNVRADSDVDVVVENQHVTYFDYFPRSSAPSPDPNANPYTGRWDDPDDWREEVRLAMVRKFGGGDVDSSGEVAITIAEVTGSRPSADVVPSFDYRRYDSPDRRVAHVGSRVFKRSGGTVANYPDQQKANGIAKDQNTGGRYKKYVRALKNAENFLAAQGINKELPSYFMECLVWNVPNSHIALGGTLDQGFRNTLAYLFNNLLPAAYDYDDWVEPNDLKYLFYGDKWSREDGFKLVDATWELLGYE
ncbi:hypothetical protein EDD33_0833 [Nocardioides aurantiacus]|uniref:cGAS/DncV-like nucleotidyltransferase C-terminal helical domain-containing protein n=2 Tax=Nocardioides aurantiacus TaxID=86796 RepID=A0A3N2CR58_9ACTN|nr:hypothetical protein EDD33_0833 [Nocardioides aurantiacus]